MSLIGIMDSLKWLTVYELALCLLQLIVLGLFAIPFKNRRRWMDYAPSFGLPIVAASLLTGNDTLPALVLYAHTIILFAFSVRRLLRPKWHQSHLQNSSSSSSAARPRVLARFFQITACLCGIIPIVLALSYAGSMRYNPASDFSELSYSKAFANMNSRLEKEYPFGDWKRIDWLQLKEHYEPIFRLADQRKDAALYYKTLKSYLSELRDGHIKIINDNLYNGNRFFYDEVGGGFGISTIGLDNGKVLVNLVLENSAAAQSGIKPGAELLTWDGKPAQQAYDDVAWSENSAATNELTYINKGRFLARAPVGREVQAEFRNWGEEGTIKVQWRAADDQFETLKRTKPAMTREQLETEPPIESKVLDNGFGYMKVKHFLPDTRGGSQEQEMRQALLTFQERRVKGIIVDLRNNPGGSDQLGAEMVGYFVNKPLHYEYVSYYNRYTGKFEINRNEIVTVKPQKPHWNGEVVLLVNSYTASTGEGMPLLMKGMPNVQIVGFTPTAGSFAVMSSPIEIKLPEGYVVRFPDGRSLDGQKQIQGDADGTGAGGAAPDMVIPTNEETFRMQVLEARDVELDWAIKALDARW
ncbi:S41 family peptidase [Paenibacillus sp. GCM10027627]|uniref:S41 family peptidase n=1 Tax=unclassified Paenibacillus TaxID=185978 RepID=UPI00363116CC